MSLADSPKVVKAILESRLDGKSQAAIAADYGIAQSTVGLTLNKPAVRAVLEKAYGELVNLAPRVAKVYEEEVFANPESVSGRELRLRAAKQVAEMVGLSPVRDATNNVFFTQVIGEQHITLNPLVSRAIERLTARIHAEEDPVDVEFEEETNESA